MKIVLVSDNHGRECLEQIQNDNLDADYFVHCGDSEFPESMLHGFLCVKGNNDYYSRSLPEYAVLDFKDHRALVVHGHLFSYVYMKEAMGAMARKNNCDIVFYGHTHRFDFSVEDGITFINPGSCRSNRDWSNPCYAIVTLNAGKIDVKRVDL